MHFQTKAGGGQLQFWSRIRTACGGSSKFQVPNPKENQIPGSKRLIFGAWNLGFGILVPLSLFLQPAGAFADPGQPFRRVVGVAAKTLARTARVLAATPTTR